MHATKRVAKAVLIGAIPPLMLKTAANPGGTSIRHSINFVMPILLTGRSSGKASACRSTTTTGRVQKSWKVCVNCSGSKG